jgi:hypothetical protein
MLRLSFSRPLVFYAPGPVTRVHIMNLSFRPRGSSVGSTSHPRRHRHHRSSSNITYPHTSHSSDPSLHTSHEPRQASLQLDFIIVGGGLFYAPYPMHFTLATDTLLRQESPGFPQHMPSLLQAIVFECLNERVAWTPERGVYDCPPLQPESYRTGELKRNWNRRLL